MTTSDHPSSCPSCGAPTGRGNTCEFCGSPLGQPTNSKNFPDQPTWDNAVLDWNDPATEPAGDQQDAKNDPVEAWMREEARPGAFSPRRDEPFSPPPPSGLEPISLALNEAAQAGKQTVTRILKPVLIGCAVLFGLAVGCGTLALVLFWLNRSSF